MGTCLADKWDFERVETFGATNDSESLAFSVSVDKVLFSSAWQPTDVFISRAAAGESELKERKYSVCIHVKRTNIFSLWY